MERGPQFHHLQDAVSQTGHGGNRMIERGIDMPAVYHVISNGSKRLQEDGSIVHQGVHPSTGVPIRVIQNTDGSIRTVHTVEDLPTPEETEAAARRSRSESQTRQHNTNRQRRESLERKRARSRASDPKNQPQ